MFRLDNGSSIKAFCDIQIDNDYIVKGFKVVEGKEGMFVGMPSEVGKSGKWFSTFHPLSDDVRNRIEQAVMTAYEE
jgi:stage V sporulation protein G